MPTGEEAFVGQAVRDVHLIGPQRAFKYMKVKARRDRREAER